MKYVLGVDSGGTKYLLKAASLDGRVLASHIGSPAPHYKLGTEEAFRRIKASVESCLAAFGGRLEDCAAITVGTTGMDAPEDEAVIGDIYRRLPGFHCPLQTVNDAQVAHWAATGGVGVVVIAGTGSIAYGRDAQGNEWRVGGWPPCIGGDEGSGTWLVCRVLEHVSHVMDGRHAPTPLYERMRRDMRLDSPGRLIQLCQQLERGTFQNPGVGIWVNELADAGDPLCRELLARAGEEAAGLVSAVADRLSFDGAFVVGAWGSAIVKSAVQLETFKAAVRRRYPQAEVRVAQRDAADGAVDMALAQLNGKREEHETADH